jgi:hypothetical protein
MKQQGILIGGAALVQLGSDRRTEDTDYLINDISNTKAFIHDVASNIDYINANGNKFFSAIYATEAGKEIASPQALLELKAYSFVQHCQNFNWKKVDAAEYDMKFLVRTFGLKGLKIANKFMTTGELSEVNKVINSVKK